MTVVYAHLSAFSDSIESIVYTEQEKKNRFQIDKWLMSGAVPVRKGEVIGYTGRSGCRDPHLHFEVRNAQNHPVNPLSLGYAIEDFVGPSVSSVSVTPVFFGSHVAGDFKPKRFPVLKSGGSYI